MAYPAGYSSDEEFDAFLSDEDEPGRPEYNLEQKPIVLTQEQKLNNFYFAIFNGALSEVILALDEGIHVDVILQDGWTPILLAASVGNAETVLELVKRGANVKCDRDKFTPLMAICTCPDSTSAAPNRLQIIDVLIKYGANIEAITRKRQTAFMYAAANGNTVILEYLIPICNKNAVDNQGWTALFWAVNNNNVEAVKLLLDAGLSSDKIDIRGNTVLQNAVQQDCEEIIKMLSGEQDELQVIRNNSLDLYNVEDLFKDLRPCFFRDISGMLYGMKCEQLEAYFANMDLLEFLSLDNNALKELGIELPYQRYRILTGLHKFHGSLFKQKSIPFVPKDALFSTVDVSNALLAAVRQLIAMEASVMYISQLDLEENTKQLEVTLKTVRMRLQKVKRAALALNLKACKWDGQVNTVDLVPKVSLLHKPKRWFKYLGYISILTVSIIFCIKRQT